MKTTTLLLLFVSLSLTCLAQTPQETEDWSRKPDLVTPGDNNAPPSDAIVLWGKKGDLKNWEGNKEKPATWTEDDCLTVNPKTGGIRSKEAFGDVQMHIEWRSPEKVEGKGQGRGNSGIYFMGLYEVQVLDSYENETYYNGQASSIYKQHIPLANASRPPGVWQEYDIIFKAPRFKNDGSLESPACFTVIHNGVLVQNHVKLKGPTVFIGKPKYKSHAAELPVFLQDHNNPVSYRNIWIRKL